MPGLDLRSIRVIADEALKKPAKKFQEAWGQAPDPIPARTPCDTHNGRFCPGGYAPDPVPSTPAFEYEAPSARLGEGRVVDPIPARSVF